jgi:hypothetical protein
VPPPAQNEAINRRERFRRLALNVIDNHLGRYPILSLSLSLSLRVCVRIFDLGFLVIDFIPSILTKIPIFWCDFVEHVVCKVVLTKKIDLCWIIFTS